MKPHGDYEDEYEMGYGDYHLAKPVNECPYSDVYEVNAWREGWYQAQLDKALGGG